MIFEQQTNYDDLRIKCENLLERCINSEDRSRKTNIVISGLQTDENLTVEKNVERMFVDKLNIPSEKVDTFLYRNIHFLGANKQGKSRSIIVAFLKQTDRDLVFSKAKELKGSSISIRGNYSFETATRKNDLMLKRKNLISQGFKARVIEKNYKPQLQVLGDNGHWKKHEDEDQDDSTY